MDHDLWEKRVSVHDIGGTVHYEIQGRQTGKWSIIDVKKDRAAAVKMAESLWDKGQHKGIKVLKEDFDSATNVFKTMDIFTRGVEKKISKHDNAGEISPCLTPDNLYSADGRRSIWDLLHNSLYTWGITPTELLHSDKHYLRLYDAGTQLQNAVQRTAVSYEDDEDSIQVRMNKLYKVINTAVDILRGEEKNIPSLEEGRLKPIIEKLDTKINRAFLLTAALTNYMEPALALEEKLGRVAIFMNKNRPSWVNDILDQFSAELLQYKSLNNVLMADCKERGHMLIALAHFAAGQLEKSAEMIGDVKFSPDMLRVNNFIASNILPRTCRRLVNHLLDEIKSSEPITAQFDMIQQFKLLFQLDNALETLSETQPRFGDVSDEISSRQARMVNGQSIADYLALSSGPFKKIHALIHLGNVTTGRTVRRNIANYIFPILSKPENESHMLGLNNSPIGRMADLAYLQKQIYKSSFDSMHKQQIAKILDGHCNTIVTNTAILSKVDAKNISISEKAIKILDMLNTPYFTYGKARDHAEQMAKKYLSDPKFAPSLLKDAPKERHSILLGDVQKRMKKAFVPLEQIDKLPPA